MKSYSQSAVDAATISKLAAARLEREQATIDKCQKLFNDSKAKFEARHWFRKLWNNNWNYDGVPYGAVFDLYHAEEMRDHARNILRISNNAKDNVVMLSPGDAAFLGLDGGS